MCKFCDIRRVSRDDCTVRGEWPQHVIGPLSLTERHALCIRAEEMGEPMITENTEGENG